jgi:GxxExxY protein
MNREELNLLSEKIIGCSIEVHRHLGPGLLESAYQECLEYEFDLERMNYKKEYSIPLIYKGKKIDCSYRVDYLVEDEIIVELKSVEQILPIHKAQLLTYLKITDKKLGLLINFNVSLLNEGIVRLVNNF